MTERAEPVGRSSRDLVARIAVIGVFVSVWLANWIRETTTDDPYYDSGMAGFLIATAFAVGFFAALYLPAIWAVLVRDMPPRTRLTAAGAVVGAVAITVLWRILYDEVATLREADTAIFFAVALSAAGLTDVFVLRLTAPNHPSQQPR